LDLNGRYQLWFDMTTPDAMRAAKQVAAGAGNPVSPSDADLAAMDAEANAIQGAQALGLRLEKTKAQVDCIFVDHIDKGPTEN
jgi:uncharacterized protein (TIGR03435 family)